MRMAQERVGRGRASACRLPPAAAAAARSQARGAAGIVLNNFIQISAEHSSVPGRRDWPDAAPGARPERSRATSTCVPGLPTVLQAVGTVWAPWQPPRRPQSASASPSSSFSHFGRCPACCFACRSEADARCAGQLAPIALMRRPPLQPDCAVALSGLCQTPPLQALQGLPLSCALLPATDQEPRTTWQRPTSRRPLETS